MNFPVVEAEDMPDIAADAYVDRLRRFRPRLSGRRPRRRARAARSLLRQALCAVLHDQARRRRRAGLRRHQAAEVRGLSEGVAPARLTARSCASPATARTPARRELERPPPNARGLAPAVGGRGGPLRRGRHSTRSRASAFFCFTGLHIDMDTHGARADEPAGDRARLARRGQGRICVSITPTRTS